MKWRSPIFLATVVFVVVAIFLFSYVTLRYLQGYKGYTLIAETNAQFLAPPQDVYKRNAEIMAAIQFLSSRWNTHLDDLYVLAVRRMQSLTEIGIVDSSSLTSARVIIPNSTFPNVRKLSDESIAYTNNIYLVNEFKPTSSMEVKIAKRFYSAEAPSVKEPQEFAVIVWWNIEPSGDGNIKALTTGGYLTVPVIRGFVLKRLGYIED